MPWRQKSGNRLEFLSICLPVRKEWFHVCSLPRLLISDLSRAGKNVKSVFVQKIKSLLAQAFIWAMMAYARCWQPWGKALLYPRDKVTSVQSTRSIWTLKVQVEASTCCWRVNTGNIQGTWLMGLVQVPAWTGRHIVIQGRGVLPLRKPQGHSWRLSPLGPRSCEEGRAKSQHGCATGPLWLPPASARWELLATGESLPFALPLFLYPSLIYLV